MGGLRALKEREYQGHLRIYGIEGEAGREGEGRTRIRESSRRRMVSLVTMVCSAAPDSPGAGRARLDFTCCAVTN